MRGMRMKKSYVLCLVLIAILGSLSVCYGNEEKGHLCFRVIDADKDGAVTFQEFNKYFGENKKQFDEIDLNSDGKLSHDEYHESLGHGNS